MRRFYVALVDAGPAIGTPLRLGCVVVSDDLDAFPEHEQTILGPAQMDAPCPEWAATEFCRLHGLSEETEIEYDLHPPPGTQDPDRYAPEEHDQHEPCPYCGQMECGCNEGCCTAYLANGDGTVRVVNLPPLRALPLPVPEQGTLFA